MSNSNATSVPEDSYAEWLKARLAGTIAKLDSGEMKSYPSWEGKTILASRLAARRELKASVS